MSRSRSIRLGAALAAAAAVAALAGCAAAPAGASRPTSTPAALTCPSADQVAGLTATPFVLTERSGRCTYTATADGARRTVVVQHPATATLPRNATLTAVRDEVAPDAPSAVRTAKGLDFPAFVTRSSGSCTTWLYAADGVVTTVTAHGSGNPCALGASVAALTGAAPTASAQPVVDVVVRSGTLTTAEGAALRKRIASGTHADVRLLTGDVDTASASVIDRDAAAVVYLGPVRGDAPVAVAEGASKAFSAAVARAQRARLLVVAPTGSSTSRSALRAAARIAGATWIDAPGVGGDGSALADPIVRALRLDVL